MLRYFFGGKAASCVKNAPSVALDIIDKLLEHGISWIKPRYYGEILTKKGQI